MTKTPWHIWVVGGLSLLWNAGGAFDFTMSATQNAAYLAQLTDAQRAYFSSFPIWVMVTWGVAVWSAVFGSILLFLRNMFAVLAFGIGLATLLATALYNYVLADVKLAEITGLGATLFSTAILIVAILLFLYAKSQKSRGVLT